MEVRHPLHSMLSALHLGATPPAPSIATTTVAPHEGEVRAQALEDRAVVAPEYMPGIVHAQSIDGLLAPVSDEGMADALESSSFESATTTPSMEVRHPLHSMLSALHLGATPPAPSIATTTVAPHEGEVRAQALEDRAVPSSRSSTASSSSSTAAPMPLDTAERELAAALAQLELPGPAPAPALLVFQGDTEEQPLPPSAGAARIRQFRATLGDGSSARPALDALGGALSAGEPGRGCAVSLDGVGLVVEVVVVGIPRWMWGGAQESAVAEAAGTTYGAAIAPPVVRRVSSTQVGGRRSSPLSRMRVELAVPFAAVADARAAAALDESAALGEHIQRALHAPERAGVAADVVDARVELQLDVACAGDHADDALTPSALRAAWRRAHLPRLAGVEVMGVVGDGAGDADWRTWRAEGEAALAAADASFDVRKPFDDAVEARQRAEVEAQEHEALVMRLRQAIGRLQQELVAKQGGPYD